MEWELEVKLNFYFFAVARKKDKFFKKGDKRWQFLIKKGSGWGYI